MAEKDAKMKMRKPHGALVVFGDKHDGDCGRCCKEQQ